MQFADRLRKMREARGLTQRELATAIGVSRQAIGLYEAGEREPDLTTIQKLAHVLRTSISYLVGETDDPSPLPRSGVAAHREGTDPGDPLDPEVQLIMERAFREISRKLEEKWRQRQQGESQGGEASPNGRH
ncbi:helix-turn-helix domain protein [Thermaerobacter marianensis DSM 12885]|uniref:Helix-turn-helix domain protein n=1 Tax=Thermaerobacter marianensis (strain ATCC 700841 / DSM 12885 / JCM 10246 / 7p75a) TaxID=644966 RepID=E6SKF2_THEM7|nr:helix-turn-helix transcriptional regulator [Thermaerobacter marianensis]ADU50139.1 helix-turn-helix domain protein [Thermaerobacter marianensis DSM 12885]